MLPKVSYQIKYYVHYCKPLLDVYHGAFKDNHRYWFGLELILVVIIFGVTALNYKISLILNMLILAGIVVYLCYVQPFNSLKNSLLEWSFQMNAIVLLMLTFSMENLKNKIYFNLLNFLIALAFVEFLGIILFIEMNPYKNLNILDEAYNYTEFREELLGKSQTHKLSF